MEQKFQSSFIPKKQDGNSGLVSKVKKPATMFYWLSMIVFFLSLVLAGTLFAYEKFVLVQQLEEKKQQIQNEINSFDKELTNTLTVMKKRIDSGKDLLAGHIDASAAFELLESLAVENVFFSEFSFSATPGGQGIIEVFGEAPNYAVLAFQSDVLKDSNKILNPKFHEVNLNDFGRVAFQLSADIDPSVISYQENLSASEQPEDEFIEDEFNTETIDEGTEEVTEEEVENESGNI